MDKQQDLAPIATAKNKVGDKSKIFAKYYEEGKRPLSTTVNKKTPNEVFNLLNNLENFPQFFENLEKVERVNDTRATWYFKNHGPSFDSFSVAMNLEFDAQANSMVWKSETAAGFDYTVGIELEAAPASRGTVVRLMIAYDNPVGEWAALVEHLFGKDADMTSKRNLHRLKAFCETGSVPTTEGQPSGRDEDLQPEMKH